MKTLFSLDHLLFWWRNLGAKQCNSTQITFAWQMFGEFLCLFWGFIYTEWVYACWFAFSNVKCMREELIIWLHLCCRVDLEIGSLLFCQELVLCHILYILKNKSMACSVRGVFSFPEHFKVEWMACLILRAPRIEKHGPPFSQPRMLAVIWWKLQSTTFRVKAGRWPSASSSREGRATGKRCCWGFGSKVER